MLQGFHHIELNVRDIESSFAFYSLLQRFFETSTIERSGDSFQWTFGDSYLYVNPVADRFANRTYHRKSIGLDHLAFTVDDLEEVLALQEFLIANTIPILYKADWYGPKYFAVYCEDPDRIKLEFGTRTAPHST